MNLIEIMSLYDIWWQQKEDKNEVEVEFNNFIKTSGLVPQYCNCSEALLQHMLPSAEQVSVQEANVE